MKKIAVLILAVSILAVSAVAGCGGGEDEATSTVAPPVVQAPATEAPTVEAPMAETPTAAAPTAAPAPTSAPTVAPAPTEAPMTPMVEIETIIFSDLNWSSAQTQNRIAQFIIEHGYGYETDVVFGATIPLLQAMRRGEINVNMEIWLPNQQEAWLEATADGTIETVGHSLGQDWQSSFVIPRYLQEQYPDLDSVEDLKDPQYKDLFDTPETDGKARLVSCVIGWACETANAAQIEAYGLSDHVHIVNPGDSAAGNADLYGAYERQEPWLGYQWGTNDPALTLDLVTLEEPAPYSAECWASDMGCAYKLADILIAVRTEVAEGAPDVIEMFKAWTFDIPQWQLVVRWKLENPNADTNDSALWWLTNNEDIWSTWVTDDAADGDPCGPGCQRDTGRLADRINRALGGL